MSVIPWWRETEYQEKTTNKSKSLYVLSTPCNWEGIELPNVASDKS